MTCLAATSRTFSIGFQMLFDTTRTSELLSKPYPSGRASSGGNVRRQIKRWCAWFARHREYGILSLRTHLGIVRGLPGSVTQSFHPVQTWNTFGVNRALCFPALVRRGIPSSASPAATRSGPVVKASSDVNRSKRAPHRVIGERRQNARGTRLRQQIRDRVLVFLAGEKSQPPRSHSCASAQTGFVACMFACTYAATYPAQFPLHVPGRPGGMRSLDDLP